MTNKTTSGCPPSTKPGWEIVFCDEFDGAVFSEKNYWNPSGTWTLLGGGTHGDELQYYTRFDKNFPTTCDKGNNNYDQSGGTLKIITKNEPGNYEVWHWDQNHVSSNNPTGFYTQCEHFDYTSGWIQTPGKFLYGYFEIRAKIPNQGLVLWPAFWLWAAGDSGKEYREIDIFEFGSCQSNLPNYVGHNMHISRDIDNGYIQNPSDPINHYPGSYIISGYPGVSDDFHTYAVKWSPNSVIWYVDDKEVYKVVQHTPHQDMYVIANMAIASWCNPAGNSSGIVANAFPYVFEIDYIRVYQSLSEEFLWQWGNGGNSMIAGWYLNPGDQFVVGDFDKDGHDEILAVAKNGWSKLLKHDGYAWQDKWHNNGSKAIAGWNLNIGDRFIAGDFDKDGQDEILAIAINGWSKLLKYSGSAWQDKWHNNGSKTIAGWNMNPGDQFIAGDFDKDGQDEILAIAINGWSKLLKYSGSAWQDMWHNNGSKTIAGWNMHPGDQFIAGDFDKDGQDEILAIANTGWSKLLKYSGSTWQDMWHNNGSKTIAGWNMHPGDQFIAGDFDKDGKGEILAISTTGWSKLLKYSSSTWQDVWHNDGGKTIHLWYMKPTDMYLCGDFDGDGKANLLARATNGWVHMLQMSSIFQ